MLIWRGWWGNLKRVLCYFEYGVIWRGCYATLNMGYFEEGVMLLWIWGTLKRVLCYFEYGIDQQIFRFSWFWRFFLKFIQCGQRRKWIKCFDKVASVIFLANLNEYDQVWKHDAWYFEESGVVLWRGWCGTLKRVVWYFEEGCVVLWRRWHGTLRRVVWYFEEGSLVLWGGWCGTLKRVVG